MICESIMKTKQGKQYLNKLCRHFARQVPTSIIGSQARIELHNGVCRIRVTDQHMYFHIDVENDHEIKKAEQTVTEQLLRITRMDKINLQWQRHH